MPRRGERRSVEERFWEKVSKDDSCWSWIGAKNKCGYGTFMVEKGKVVYAHRYAYERLNGVVPEGFELDHLCRQRECVNPVHLEPVSHRENMLRSPVAIVAVNASKVSCPNGHPYDLTDTWRDRNYVVKARRCSICRNEQARQRYHEKRRVA